MNERRNVSSGFGMLRRHYPRRRETRGSTVFGACVLSITLAGCGSGGGPDSGFYEQNSGPQLESKEVPWQPVAGTEPNNSGSSNSAVGSTPAVGTNSPVTKPAPQMSAEAPRDGASPATTALNWIETLVDDMKLYHDGPVRTLEYIPKWGSGWGTPTYYQKPPGWTTAGPWGVIMADTNKAGTPPIPWRVPGPYTGNTAPNTRVQVRDMQLWWLRKDGAWVRGSYTASPGGYMYHSSWKGEQYTTQNEFRDESNNGGGKSARFINMNGPNGSPQFDAWHWHFFGPRADAPSDYVGFATAFFARKILHDPNGPDDRASARLLADTAGDWWITPYAQWDNFKTNGPMGYSRFKYLGNDWLMVSFHSLTEAEIRANPPPIIGIR